MDEENRFRQILSLPAWGVWIEIDGVEGDSGENDGHSPHGECGLK